MLTPAAATVRYRAEWEGLLSQFVEAWNAGDPPNLRSYCPPQADPALLLELIKIDVVKRTAAGLTLSFEEYLEACPELCDQADFVERLLALTRRDTISEVSADPNLDFHISDPSMSAADNNRPVTVTAAYDNIRPHAQGGLGEVYVADDTALNRSVALKVIQERYHKNERAVRNFLREAEITSRLEHPGIVPVHGIGTSPSGIPCYSMRFVEGETLRTAIDRFHEQPIADPGQRGLAFRELLARFVAVCNTVAYAHSRGVVHRDLKPENVMLGPFGETLVLDWGLGKELDAATNGSIPDRYEPITSDPTGSNNPCAAAATKSGDVIGTPAYLSPEQARGEHEQASPAMDIFGLGATLYSILTGVPPYQDTSMTDLLRKAREGNFVPPRQVNRLTPAALEAICCKAMSREPSQRYASALELAQDTSNWLAGEKVSAWKEPKLVTLRRYLRRRRTLVGALSVAAFLVPLALILASWLIAHERAQRNLDRQRAKIKERAAAQITDFLVKTFESADPIGLDATGFHGPARQGVELTLERMLASGQQLLEEHLRDQPLLRARLLAAIGNSHRCLGNSGIARLLLQESYDLHCAELGHDAKDTLASLQNLARLEHDFGNYAAGKQIYLQVLAGRERLDPPEPLLVAETKFFLAWLMYYQPLVLARPQFDETVTNEAEALLVEVLRIREQFLPPDHRDIGYVCAVLAEINACQNNQEDLSAAYAARATQIFKNQKDDNRYGLLLSAQLAAENHRKFLRFAEADVLYEEILTQLRTQLGSHHPRLIFHMANMVGMYRKWGNVTKGLPLMRELRVRLRGQPDLRNQPVFVDALLQFGDYLLAVDRAEARDVYQEALRHAHERPTPNQPTIKKLEERLQNLNAAR